MSSAEQIVTFTNQILGQVAHLPAELIAWRPAPDVWSIQEILCHVEEFIPYWTRQTLQMINRPDEPWGRDHTDRDRKLAVESASQRDFPSVVNGIRAAAQSSAEALSRLSDGDLAVESASRNPRWGVKPARFVVDHLLVQHLEKHLGQIRRNMDQHRQAGGTR